MRRPDPGSARPGAAGQVAGGSYFHHQERAAAALDELLATEVLPVGDQAVAQVIACRHAVLDGLRERLFDMGARVDLGPGELHAFGQPQLELIRRRPVTMLDQVLAGMERPGFDPEGHQPRVVALAADAERPAILWRQAADELLQANHALRGHTGDSGAPDGPDDTASRFPWLEDPAAAWYLLGDTATTAEALCVLDDRLSEVGLLPIHSPTRSGPAATPHTDAADGAASGASDDPARATSQWSVDDRRMVLSQQARMARWHGTNDAADLAVAARTPVSGVVEPIQLVRLPTDLMPAQRRLAAYLRPSPTLDAFSDTARRMDATTFRTVAVNQRALCAGLGEQGSERPAGTSVSVPASVAVEFNRRAEIYSDLLEKGRHLVDVDHRGSNTPALWQQAEITSGLRRFGGDLRLDDRQLRDLADATHQVLNAFGRATLQETRRDTSNLRLGIPQPAGPLEPGVPARARVTRRSALDVVVSAAARMPAPSSSAIPWQRPVERESLRTRLDNTPSRGQAPHPVTYRRR